MAKNHSAGNATPGDNAASESAGSRKPPPLSRKILLAVVVLVVSAFLALCILEIALARKAIFSHRLTQPYCFDGRLYQDSTEIMDAVEAPEALGYARRYGPTRRFEANEVAPSVDERYHWLGLFGPEQGATDAKLVVFVGGSVAEGSGVNDLERNYWILLTRYFADTEGRQVLCVPRAITGYNSTQERIVLELSVIPEKPDAVIALDFFNDCFPPIYGNRPGDPINYPVRFGSVETSCGALQSIILRHSVAAKWLLQSRFTDGALRWQQEVRSNPGTFEQLVGSVVDVYLDNISRMREMCLFEGIPFAVAVQPALPVSMKNAGTAPETFDNRFICACYDELHRRAGTGEFDHYIHFLDGIFDHAPEIHYCDSIHANEAGQALLAEKLKPLVRELIDSHPLEQPPPSGTGDKAQAKGELERDATSERR